MADESPIEWTDATWSPITGCSVVSPGCTNCYAMRLAGTRLQHHPSRAGLTRDSKAGPVWTGEVRLNEQWLDQPLRWKRPRMIFVCAHGDLFHESVPDEWIDRVFGIMAAAHHHTFQVLTKRAARMRAYLTSFRPCKNATGFLTRNGDEPTSYGGSATFITAPGRWPLPNVWPGVSAEDQQRADERIPHLLATPAAVRWVSAEPSLGPVDLTRIEPREGDTRSINALTGEVWYPGAGSISSQTLKGPRLDWVVAGGESGPGARPMHPEWARNLRDQCASAGVPFFFKQWGEYFPAELVAPGADGEPWRTGPNGKHGWSLNELGKADLPQVSFRMVGKARAGRLLDGVEHNGVPSRD